MRVLHLITERSNANGKITHAKLAFPRNASAGGWSVLGERLRGALLHTAPSWWSPHHTFPSVHLSGRVGERRVLPRRGEGTEDSSSGCQCEGWAEGLGQQNKNGALVKSVTLPPAFLAASPKGTWLLLKSGALSSLEEASQTMAGGAEGKGLQRQKQQVV